MNITYYTLAHPLYQGKIAALKILYKDSSSKIVPKNKTGY
ncbi:MAG: hypothetical protein JWR09_477 [Mucilaginibacter sp.]|nr:hypothetical protein [Mucilaginibacter sp.]